MIYLIGITVSTRELYILCATFLGYAGIKAGSKVSLSGNSMVIEPPKKG